MWWRMHYTVGGTGTNVWVGQEAAGRQMQNGSTFLDILVP